MTVLYPYETGVKAQKVSRDLPLKQRKNRRIGAASSGPRFRVPFVGEFGKVELCLMLPRRLRSDRNPPHVMTLPALLARGRVRHFEIRIVLCARLRPLPVQDLQLRILGELVQLRPKALDLAPLQR